MAKITGSHLLREVQSGIFIAPVSIFGEDFPNVKAIACERDPGHNTMQFRWKTSNNTVHSFELPMGEVSAEELTALMVSMRIS